MKSCNTCRKMSYFDMSKEFMRLYGYPMPKVPKKLCKEEIAFVRRMVNDELDELEAATTIGEQADALCDGVYYLLSTAAKYIPSLNPIYDIVHRANVKKVEDRRRVVVDKTGKIEKPKGWADPKELIEAEIKRQGNADKDRDTLTKPS